ncbi:MAG: oligosaccharide flippase family protein [Polyangiaceae bacterium]|nr:oligosaccharide flippase family protein [Polyangiaceae bacterium]
MRAHLGRLARGTLTYGLGRVLGRSLSVIALPIFTRYLNPEAFGIVAMLGLIAALATPIFSLGFGTSVGLVYFEQRGADARRACIWAAAQVLALSVAVMLAIGLWFTQEISRLVLANGNMSGFVNLTLWSTAFGILAIPFQLYLQFEERAKQFVVITAIGASSNVVVGCVLVVFLGRGAAGLVEATCISQLFMLCCFIASALPYRITGGMAVAKEAVRLGLPMIPAFGFLFLLEQTSKYALTYFHGLNATGVYGVGYGLGGILGVATAAFGAAWTPFFLSFMDKQAEAKPIFGRVLTYYVMGGGFLSILFFVGSRSLVLVLTQAKFHEAFAVIGWVAAAQVFSGIFGVLLPPVYFAKEVRQSAFVQGSAVLVGMGASAVLVRLDGARGAAIALAVGYLTMAVFMHLWNRYRGDDYFQPEYEWGRVLKMALTWGLFAAVFMIPRSFPLVYELMLAAAGAVMAAACVYWQLTLSEVSLLKETVRRFFAASDHGKGE